MTSLRLPSFDPELKQKCTAHCRIKSGSERFSHLEGACWVRVPADLLDELVLRYVASGSTAPDVPLERVNIEARAGVPAIQIWEEDVVPAFGIG